MPFLDAKALENDPDGMAFLRAVIKPGPEKDEAALRPSLRSDPLQAEASPPGRADTLSVPLRSESAEAMPVA
jgi:hypothetical protein